ncbi:MAG: tetratricopeptide repeat protein [Rhodospirillaceae bacterium]|nr:tetratricopeptide repeat protein [Rhodospirillaceae bacterium]MBT5939953.1 tetratricopeptide repeat protein [Rhodospirillaceae bacterium]
MSDNKAQLLELLFSQAQACERDGDWPGAIEHYRASLTERADFLEAHHNLAVALRHTGKAAEALKSAQLAATLAPDHPTVQFSLGVSLEQVGQRDAAIVAYKISAELRPNYVAALSNLGRLLEVKGRIPESIEILERAIALAPTTTAVRLNLANSYLLGGRPDQATKLLQRLIQDDQEMTDISLSLAYNSLGVAAHVEGKCGAAIDHFRAAIDLAPEFAEAHENLAQALLFEEDYNEAWVEYEWRWLNESNRQTKRLYREITDKAVWTGAPLSGQTLLVHAEQGFGDVIQFARFVGQINKISKGVGTLIFACHAALIDLFSGLEGVDQVIDIDGEIPDFDAHLPLLSLPRLLGINDTNIPKDAYLPSGKSPKDADSRALKVGINWAGMPRHEFDPHRNRSCPVESFKSLLNLPDIEFYSLQTGPNSVELAKINPSGAIVDLNPQIQSFKDTATLISELDLVITIDTALAHLAGAMGKKVWILLATCADWRWLEENQENPRDNPWYPTARLFRQKTPGNWSDPLDDVISELQDLIL